MSVTQHAIDSAAITGLGSVNVKRATVTLDETWSPYCQATLVISPPTFGGKAIDPRLNHRATFRIVHYLAPELDSSPTYTRSFDLGVRRREVDDRTGDVTLTLESDEAILQDWRWVQPAIYRAGYTQARAAINNALAQIGAALQAGTPDAAIASAASDYPVGISGWDYCAPLVLFGDLRLWCDELRAWRLDASSAILAPTTVQLASTNTVKELTDSIDRNTDWYDACAITYSWTDINNVQQTAYDIYPSSGSGFKRALALSYGTAKPGAGTAAIIARRMAARGRGAVFTARSQYDVVPATAVQVTASDGVVLSGVVRSVTWNWDASGGGDDMNITTRDLAATPTRSWLSVPAGRKWTDVATGQPWTTYTP